VTSTQRTINFLGLDAERVDPARAHYAVLPIPYEATTTFLRGTRDGPQAILEASQQVEEFDEELGADFSTVGITTLPPIAVEHADPMTMQQRIRAAAERIAKDGKFLIALGGEHSITPAVVTAVMARHPQLSVLQIDAHGDLRDEYDGTRYSHACAMRRVVELGARVVGVGIRSMSEGEPAFARRHGVRHFYARQMQGHLDWIEPVLDALTSPVYLSIDIDGLDPAYAPGTGTPEPGGLDYYAVSTLLRRLTERHQLVAADCVEVLPIPGQRATEFLAARLIYKLIAYREHAGRR
jgi:agmatinase